MSRYSGKQGKGARAKVKEQKRIEAEVRQREADDAVSAIAHKQHIPLREARRLFKEERKRTYQFEEVDRKVSLLNEIFAEREEAVA